MQNSLGYRYFQCGLLFIERAGAIGNQAKGSWGSGGPQQRERGLCKDTGRNATAKTGNRHFDDLLLIGSWLGNEYLSLIHI